MKSYRNFSEPTWFCTNCRSEQPKEGFVRCGKYRNHCAGCEAKRVACEAKRRVKVDNFKSALIPNQVLVPPGMSSVWSAVIGLGKGK